MSFYKETEEDVSHPPPPREDAVRRWPPEAERPALAVNRMDVWAPAQGQRDVPC